MIIFLDLSDNEHEVGSVEVKVEGVYIWPFRKLRVVAYRYSVHILGSVTNISR